MTAQRDNRLSSARQPSMNRRFPENASGLETILARGIKMEAQIGNLFSASPHE
jgi:hypothetical protein